MAAEATGRDLPARQAAEDLGHIVVWDPPPDRGGKTAHARWTCTQCGRAALRNGSTIYGGALGERCPGKDTS